jgi:hypothetical protein
MGSIKETDWVIADTDQVLHHTDSLKTCKTWIANRHDLNQLPRAQRTDSPGVYYIALPDGTAYWAMDSAPTARAQGYDIPLPEIPETYGLADGQAALIDGPDGPALIWARKNHVGRQPAPDGLADVDTWAETTATRRLRSIGITTYLGRREISA